MFYIKKYNHFKKLPFNSLFKTIKLKENAI